MSGEDEMSVCKCKCELVQIRFRKTPRVTAVCSEILCLKDVSQSALKLGQLVQLTGSSEQRVFLFLYWDLYIKMSVPIYVCVCFF